jgi:nucleoside-diphosphate-sugar epimerase
VENVLITGAAGVIGRVLLEGLRDEYRLAAVDRRRVRGVSARRLDLRWRWGAERALRGVDAVVDLAAAANLSTSWATVRRKNIPTTMNVLEAARRAGVKRVVLASSNHVTGLYELDEPYASIVKGEYDGLDPSSIRRIETGDPIRPDSPYALGKALAEAAGRYYAERFGMSVICLRIGTVNVQDRPLSPRAFATLLSHDDLVRLVRCCLCAPLELGFGVFYGVSNNAWRFWDLTDAERRIGYRPRDDAERHRRSAV